MITLPSLTLSPTLTRISCTTPDSGAGTSIVALSDSSETSGSSAFTLSPTLTKISMTGTSLKSPMSGMRTSASPAGAFTGDGGALTLGLAGSAAGAPPPSNCMITLPSLTLSPTLIGMALTTPGCGAGTSIVALSDSSETSGVLGLHGVADLHEHLDHRHVLEVADVGHLDVDQIAHQDLLSFDTNDSILAGGAGCF